MTTEPGRPVVLVWLDPTQNEDAVPVLLADVSADFVVARWHPAAEDAGRADLLASVREARDVIAARGGNPDELTLIGFGRGAVAAAGLTRYTKRLGIGIGAVVAVANTGGASRSWNEWGRDEPDPFSGAPLGEIPELVELVDQAHEVPAVLTICWRSRSAARQR
ncbi:MAG TPA: hypothetical protein VMZ66_03245 [Aeromicrobium sp.]|nr:hypothetical protein [Aeromicrobium sp.]